MQNAGLKIIAEVTRADGSTAQVLVFDQRGLTNEQLRQLQREVVTPVAASLMQIMAAWGNEQDEKLASASSSPTAGKAIG